jgi:iron complex transport system ATP-binding protein
VKRPFPVISVQDLVVRRGSTQILNGLDWSVKEREHWIIMGANGSGKTTLLSCITGYVTPSRGKLSVLGRQYGKSDWRELRKEVGLVSPRIRHWIEDHQTAVEVVASGRNAELNLWHPPRGTLRQEAIHLLEQVGCQRLADRPWAYLSQGERQRVLIGRALMARYKILILDEPCSELDPVAREKFLEFLTRLAEAERTPNLLLVTHHVEEILPCFGAALVLSDGIALAQGPIENVITTSVLSQALDFPVTVRRQRGRFVLGLGIK